MHIHINNMNKYQLVDELQSIGVIKKGKFILKSGKTSDIYFDLRKLYGNPQIFQNICKHISNLIEDCDLLCGVPLGAIPLVTLSSLQKNIPMILLRHDRKEYGSKNLVEGTYKEGDRVVLIEDVITTGSSINESIEKLKLEKLEVVQIIAVIDRRQDKTQKIISLLSEDEIQSIINIPQGMINRKFVNPMATKLWQIVLDKNTNLCLSGDVGTIEKLINLVELVGDHICMLKIHWDCLTVDKESLSKLYKISKEKNFLILDDRKYADIDSIVAQQYTNSNSSDCVTAHSIFGQGTIDGIKNSGIFLIAQTSSIDNLINAEYTLKTVLLAQENREFVAGFICQSGFDSKFLHLTPGIHLDKSVEGKQGYQTPESAISQGTDIIIVGRGIYNSEMSLLECLKYKHSGWNALKKRYKVNGTKHMV